MDFGRALAKDPPRCQGGTGGGGSDLFCAVQQVLLGRALLGAGPVEALHRVYNPELRSGEIFPGRLNVEIQSFIGSFEVVLGANCVQSTVEDTKT